MFFVERLCGLFVVIDFTIEEIVFVFVYCVCFEGVFVWRMRGLIVVVVFAAD